MNPEFRSVQKFYGDNDKYEKAVAMQLIDQHNKTVEFRSESTRFFAEIDQLHIDQRNLIKYLFKEKHINKSQKIYLNETFSNIANKNNKLKQIDNHLFENCTDFNNFVETTRL